MVKGVTLCSHLCWGHLLFDWYTGDGDLVQQIIRDCQIEVQEAHIANDKALEALREAEQKEQRWGGIMTRGNTLASGQIFSTPLS